MYPCQLSHLCIPCGRSPAFSSWCYCIELYCNHWKLMNNYIACALNTHSMPLKCQSSSLLSYTKQTHATISFTRATYWLRHEGNKAKPGSACSLYSLILTNFTCPSLRTPPPGSYERSAKLTFERPWATSTSQILQTMTPLFSGFETEGVHGR